MRRDPRVSLTVIDGDDWYTHVTAIGRVVRMYDDEGLADIDALSQHYQGKPYPDRDRPRVSAVIEIDGYQFRNNRVEGDNVWQIYSPDGGMVTPALNLTAFRTAEEVETFLLEEVFESR